MMMGMYKWIAKDVFSKELPFNGLPLFQRLKQLPSQEDERMENLVGHPRFY